MRKPAKRLPIEEKVRAVLAEERRLKLENNQLKLALAAATVQGGG